MKWQHWTAGGILVVVFLIYPSCKQQDMVFTWVIPENSGISENAQWIFGRYSSGRIVQARECREIAEGWDALNAFWLLTIGLILLSAYIGTAGGYFIRGKDNDAEHKRELSELEQRYKQRIEGAERNYNQAEIWDKNSRTRFADAEKTFAEIKRWEKRVSEREMELGKIIDENVQATKKQLQNLQIDHKNRGNKLEGLEKEKISLKRENITLEKENIRLGQENLTLIKEYLALKQGDQTCSALLKRLK